MHRRVLIDTSAWIEFFRNDMTDVAGLVDELLSEDLAATTGVVRAELLQGARNRRDFIRLSDLLAALEWLPEPPDVWDRVAHLGYSMRRGGQSGIGLPDLMISVVALAHNAPVLSLDKHFEGIADNAGLELFPK